MGLVADVDMSYTGNKLPPVEIVVEVSELYCGSGSTGIDQFFSVRTGQTRTLIADHQETSEDQKKSLRIAEMEDRVLETFSINMVELAQSCGVVKKTLYNWRESGKEIARRTKGLDRLFALYLAATNWRESGFLVPGKEDVVMPLLDGESLLDVLRKDEIDLERIHFLGARLSLTRVEDIGIEDPFA